MDRQLVGMSTPGERRGTAVIYHVWDSEAGVRDLWNAQGIVTLAVLIAISTGYGK